MINKIENITILYIYYNIVTNMYILNNIKFHIP